ncbi:hypothetical protein [Shewanella sp.]|uniref:hypothetical protein n=1 Tax=Shewanella sp. TaxID=50422 RepID=UPI001A602DA8|nr:hypothetical protein [Shewanella sp.]MBL4817149.1 hypothetical protein [Shewanella sp.]MCJ8302063.1 hypothetical protein [Shewanella sp.]
MKRLSIILSTTIISCSYVYANNSHEYISATSLDSGLSAVHRVHQLSLTNSTQGPFWPPSEFMDQHGDFVLVGNILARSPDGQILPRWGAAIISKNTVPPLDINGVEDFTNEFSAAYRVVRELDLSGPDKDIELFSVSFGPSRGNFGGGARIPKLGNSTYNLNSGERACPELFPTSAEQADNYTKESFAINRVPIWGFQGDHIQYAADSGLVEDPFDATGPDCGEGCSGENIVDSRDTSAYTLEQHLAADGELRVKLLDWNSQANAYTAARFTFKFTQLLPNRIYSIWAIRSNAMLPTPQTRRPDPLGLPNIIVTNKRGKAKISFIVENPFPLPESDLSLNRIQGIAVGLNSSMQTWGACADRLGPGVTIHGVFNSMFWGTSLENAHTISPVISH